MTQDEAIAAIRKARKIYVIVSIHSNPDGTEPYTETFRIRKEVAVAALKELSDTEYEHNIEISEGGAEIVIGKGWVAQPSTCF